jgi:hypothetical protein
VRSKTPCQCSAVLSHLVGSLEDLFPAVSDQLKLDCGKQSVLSVKTALSQMVKWAQTFVLGERDCGSSSCSVRCSSSCLFSCSSAGYSSFSQTGSIQVGLHYARGCQTFAWQLQLLDSIRLGSSGCALRCSSGVLQCLALLWCVSSRTSVVRIIASHFCGAYRLALLWCVSSRTSVKCAAVLGLAAPHISSSCQIAKSSFDYHHGLPPPHADNRLGASISLK